MEIFMQIELCRQNKTPLFLQIKNQIKVMILNGELINGYNLPSERELAKELGVHRNTIISSYRELKSEGLVNSTKGHYYSVTYETKHSQLDLTSKKSLLTWENLFNYDQLFSKNLFDQMYIDSTSSDGISFASVTAPSDAYSKEELRSVFTDLVQSQDIDIFEYSPAQGVYSLRNNIAKLLKERQIKATPNDIHIVSETNQALDYIAKLLINPGDVIIIEEPVGPAVYRFFKYYGAKIITIPMDENGMITNYLEKLIQKYHPKLIYTFPTFHSPTGTVMSLSRRYELLNCSYKFNVPIIEEDWFSDLRYDGTRIPSLKALDKHKHVIYIDSFVLAFAPGVTAGYVVATPQIIEKLKGLTSSNMAFVNNINQYLISSFLEKGIYHKNLQRLRNYYREKRDLICLELDKTKDLGISYYKPAGSVFLWCKLPGNINLTDLIIRSTRLGVTFVPGFVFFPHGTKGDNYIRLCYCYSSILQIKDGIRLLIQAINECRE